MTVNNEEMTLVPPEFITAHKTQMCLFIAMIIYIFLKKISLSSQNMLKHLILLKKSEVILL